MTHWIPPQRPANYAEQALISAILEGIYPPGSFLPGERELSVRLGITRPTLREALQRLDRDGWLKIQQGKLTQVADFWHEGGLNVLNALIRYGKELPADFVPNLLEVRLALAPAYTRAAVERHPDEVLDLMTGAYRLEEDARAYAAFDWQVHYRLTVASQNPIYTLILNGFAGFYQQMAEIYFRDSQARQSSRTFYAELRSAAERKDPLAAEEITRRVMQESLTLWRSGPSLSELQIKGGGL